MAHVLKGLVYVLGPLSREPQVRSVESSTLWIRMDTALEGGDLP